MPIGQSKIQTESIEHLIIVVRGRRVILDADLARIYAVSTKRLNEQIKRNVERFPDDFMFRLTRAETETLLRSRSQNATLKRGSNIKYSPCVLTEFGAIMAANVMNSPQAVRMSVFVVRAFVQMRELLTGTQELARQLKDLEARLTSRLDTHEAAIVKVLRSVMEILNPPPLPEPIRPKIGFNRGVD
jgi:ORF6N domain